MYAAARIGHQVFPPQGVGFRYHKPVATITPQKKGGQKPHSPAANDQGLEFRQRTVGHLPGQIQRVKGRGRRFGNCRVHGVHRIRHIDSIFGRDGDIFSIGPGQAHADQFTGGTQVGTASVAGFALAAGD